MTLNEVLTRYATRATEIKAGSKGPSSEALNLDQFRSEIEAVRSGSRSAFNIAVGMLVVVFVIACAVVLAFVNKPSVIAGVLAASGVSITGVVTTMIRLWKQKVASDILISLAMNLSDDNVQAVINILKEQI
jgi:hypothetical protein